MTKQVSSGSNPVITAYDRGNVFLRHLKYIDRSLLLEVGKEYLIGTVLGVVTANGKCAFLDVALTDGKEIPKFILAQDVVNSAIAATAGNFLSADISANLAGILAPTDAEFTITVDGGTPEVVPAIDFTAGGGTTLADVAALLQVAIQAAVTVVAIGNTIKISSNSTGASSSILLVDSAGSGTDFTGASYLNVAGGAYTAGVAAIDVDVDNVRVLAEGEVDANLLLLPAAVTVDTVVSGQGMVKNLLKTEGIVVIEGQENTFLDNGASLT